jgi:hypothetical protein
MIIIPKDVPDAVLNTLLAEQPVGNDEDRAWRDDWRSALALALTAWENRPQSEHVHDWKTLDVQHQKVIVMITHVLQRCTGCGDLRTGQLNGEWTLDQVTQGR